MDNQIEWMFLHAFLTNIMPSITLSIFRIRFRFIAVWIWIKHFRLIPIRFQFKTKKLILGCLKISNVYLFLVFNLCLFQTEAVALQAPWGPWPWTVKHINHNFCSFLDFLFLVRLWFALFPDPSDLNLCTYFFLHPSLLSECVVRVGWLVAFGGFFLAMSDCWSGGWPVICSTLTILSKVKK